MLTNTEYHLAAPGATFAGRDVFAPVAAQLCNGVPLAELGEAIDPAELVPGVIPVPRLDGADVVAEVLWVDHFGNAQLNLGPEDVAGWDGVARLQWGDEVRTATVGHDLRRDRDRRHRPRPRFLRSARACPSCGARPPTSSGSAPGTEIRLSPAVSGRSGGRVDGGLTVPVALRRTDGPGEPSR